MKIQGECIIDSICLVNQDDDIIDISQVCSNINFFESIDQYFCSGRLSVVDSRELIKNFKLVGQESLTVKIRPRDDTNTQDGYATKENSIFRTFRIYSITDEKVLDTINAKTYVLHFVDPKYFLTNQKRISKVLFGSWSDILLKEYRELCFKDREEPANLTDHWEKSDGENKQLVCPDWTFTELTDYIVATAKELETKSPFENDMFFYDTIFGGVNRFMSFAKMLTLETPVTFDTYPRIDIATGEDDPNMNAPYTGLNTQILEFERPKRANLIEAILGGAYASKLTSYDPIRKIDRVMSYDSGETYHKIKEKNNIFPLVKLDYAEKVSKATRSDGQNVPDILDQYQTLSLNETLSADALSFDRINPTNIFSVSDQLVDSTSSENKQEYIANEFKDDALCKRNSLLLLMDQLKISVVIPFRTDISCGTMIRLSLPLVEPNSEKASNKMDNGSYLITKVNHEIEPIMNRGIMRLECIKIGYDTDLVNYTPLDEEPTGDKNS